MTAVTWQGRLNSATTVAEIISVAKDFVARMDPWEISALPTECRPGKFFQADDVAEYALTLAQHCGRSEDGTDAVVEKLAAFFSHASLRLAAAESPNYQSPADTRRSA